jgi:Ca2+-binding EF-hand superfamily protein
LKCPEKRESFASPLTRPKLNLYVTQVFDEDRSGKLDFVEYMMAVQSTKLRTPEDKLNWIFKIYDKVRDKFQVGKFG